MEKGLQEMTQSAVCTFDSMASEYDSWYENKGKLIFNIEIQALQQVFWFDAGGTMTVAGKAKRRSNIERGDRQCLP